MRAQADFKREGELQKQPLAPLSVPFLDNPVMP